MAKKISTSQLKSKLRKFERDYNKAVSDYNREVKKAVSNYNSAVRKYNTSVRHNQQIIKRELNKLNTTKITAHQEYRVTLTSMGNSYQSLSARYQGGDAILPEQERYYELIEQEHANGLVTANYLLNNEIPEENTEDIALGDKLFKVSNDLGNRWKGAVFALNSNNPDAARHFCTSAREIFTEFIEKEAPDKEVFIFNPKATKTDRGNATRKEKIRYMMRNVPLDEEAADFADADIANILELFHVLSDGTHGEAGKYEFEKLLQVKKRVEQGINFLCEIIG